MPEQITPYTTYRTPVTQRQWLTQRRVYFQEMGDRNIVVNVGGNIQEAIDRLQRYGGGIIRLSDGTHLPTTDLTFPAKTPIQILGINMTTTIVDFAGNRRFILAGSNIYTTGTVSISSGTTVTGSSTAWLTSGLVAGDEIFLDSRWYKIAAVAGDTTIILQEGYGGGALSGATYRAGSIVRDVEFTELTIQNSTSTSGAIDGDDCRNILLEDVTVALCAKGIHMKNFSEYNADRSPVAACTSDGITFDTGTFCNLNEVPSVGHTGTGVVFTSVSEGGFLRSVANGNGAGGYKITSCATIDFVAVQANGNTGIGIEGISGNSNIQMVGVSCAANSTDGIKLTATSDYCKITNSHFAFNGGYGVNITASTCDNNIIALSTFNTNTSGNYNDSGTNTVLVGV